MTVSTNFYNFNGFQLQVCHFLSPCRQSSFGSALSRWFGWLSTLWTNHCMRFTRLCKMTRDGTIPIGNSILKLDTPCGVFSLAVGVYGVICSVSIRVLSADNWAVKALDKPGAVVMLVRRDAAGSQNFTTKVKKRNLLCDLCAFCYIRGQVITTRKISTKTKHFFYFIFYTFAFPPPPNALQLCASDNANNLTVTVTLTKFQKVMCLRRFVYIEFFLLIFSTLLSDVHWFSYDCWICDVLTQFFKEVEARKCPPNCNNCFSLKTVCLLRVLSRVRSTSSSHR